MGSEKEESEILLVVWLGIMEAAFTEMGKAIVEGSRFGASPKLNFYASNMYVAMSSEHSEVQRPDLIG